MKVLILCASGNTTGYTYHMCQVFSDEMSSGGSQAEVADLSVMGIEDCTGCQGCAGGNGCIIGDDMSALYKVLECVDLLVLATPIRFSGPSSILKRFLDRMNPYWYSKRPHPKYVCALMCGGSSQPKFSNALSEMKAMSITVGMEWLGELCIPDTDQDTMSDGRIRDFAKTMMEIRTK